MYQKPSYKSQTINESSITGSPNLFSDHESFDTDNRHNRLTFSPRLAPRHLSGGNSSNHSHSTATQRYTMSSTINTGPSAKTTTRIPTDFSTSSTRIRNPSSVIHGYSDLSWSNPIHNVPISSSNRPRMNTNSPSTGSSAHNMFPSPLSAAVNDERDQFSIFGSFNRTRSERRDRSDRYETLRPVERSMTPGADLDSLKRSVPIDSTWQTSQAGPGLTSSGYFSPMKSGQSGPRTLLDLISRDETDEPRLNVSTDLDEPTIEEREIPVIRGQSAQHSPDPLGGSADVTNASDLRRLARTVDKLNAKLRSSQAANDELQTHLKNLLGERRALLRHIETVEVEEVIEEEEVQRAPQRAARESTSQPAPARDVPIERSHISIGDLPVRVVNAYRTEIIDHERAKMEIEKRTLLETLKIQHEHQLQAMNEQLQSQKGSVGAPSISRHYQAGTEVDLSKPQRFTLTAGTSVEPVLVSKAAQSELSPHKTLAKDTSSALRSRISRARVKTTRWQDSVLERLLAALDCGDSEALSSVLEEALLKRDTESRPRMTSRHTQIDQAEEPHAILVREANSSFRHHVRQTQITTTKAQESVLNRLVNALQTNNTTEFWSVINSSLFKSMRTVAVDSTPVTYNKNVQTKQPTFHDKASFVDISKDRPSVDKASKTVLVKPSVLHKGCQPEELFCFETGTLTDHIFYRSQGTNTVGDHSKSFQSPFPDADAFVTLKSNRSETIRQVKSQFSDINSTPSKTEIHTEKTESKQDISQVTSGLDAKLNNFAELLEKTIRIKDETDSNEDQNTTRTNRNKSPNKNTPIPIEVKSLHSLPIKETGIGSDKSDQTDEDRNKKTTEDTKDLSDSSRIHREKIEIKHTSLFQTGDIQTNLKQIPDEWEKILKAKNTKELNDNPMRNSNDNVEVPVEFTHSFPSGVSDVSIPASEELDKVENPNQRTTEEPEEPSNNFKVPSELNLKQLPDEWERILKAKGVNESNKSQIKDSTDNNQMHFERKEVKESHNLAGKKSVYVTKTTEQSSIMNIREFNQNLEKLNRDIMKTDFTKDSKKDSEIQPERIEVIHTSHLQSTVPGKELIDYPEDLEDNSISDDVKNINKNDESVTYNTMIKRQLNNNEIPIEVHHVSMPQMMSPDTANQGKVKEISINIDSDHRQGSSSTVNSKIGRQFFHTFSENQRESTMRHKPTFETWHQTTSESVEVRTTNSDSGRKSKEEIPTTVECWETISKIKDGELIENRECYRDKYVSSNPEEILKHIGSHQHDHFHADHAGHDNFPESSPRFISESDSDSIQKKFNIYLDNEGQKLSTNDTSKTLQSTVKEIPINTKVLESSKSLQSPTSTPINSIMTESSRTVSSATSSPIMGRNLKSFETISNIHTVPLNSRISETLKTVSNTNNESINSKSIPSSKTVSNKTNVPISSLVTESSKTVSYTTNVPMSSEITESSTTLYSTPNVPISSGITESPRTLSGSTNESINSRIISSSKTVANKTSTPIGSQIMKSSETISSTTNVPLGSGITESTKKISATSSESINTKIISSSKTVSNKTSVTESSKTVANTTGVPIVESSPASSNTPNLSESVKPQVGTTSELDHSKTTSSSKTVSGSSSVHSISVNSKATESLDTVPSTRSELSRTIANTTTVPGSSKVTESSHTVSNITGASTGSGTLESSKSISKTTTGSLSSKITESSKTISSTSKESILHSRKLESSKTVTGSTSVPVSSRITESPKTASESTNIPISSKISESSKTVPGSPNLSISSRMSTSSKTVSGSTSVPISSKTSESSRTVSGSTNIPINSRLPESSKTVPGSPNISISSRMSESSKTVPGSPNISISSRMSESSKTSSGSTNIPINSTLPESSKTIPGSPNLSFSSRMSESSKTIPGSPNLSFSSRMSESSKTVPGSPNLSFSSRMSESSKTASGSTSIPISSRTSESSRTVHSTSSTIPVMKYSDENDSLRNRNLSNIPSTMSLQTNLMEKGDSVRSEGVTISERIVSSSISKTSSQSSSVNVIKSPVSLLSHPMKPNDAIEKETVIKEESFSVQGDNQSGSSVKPQIFPKPIKNQTSEPFRLTPEIEIRRSDSTAASCSTVGSEKSAFYSISDSSKLFQSLDNEHFEVLLPEDIFQYSSQVLLWLNGNKQDSSISIEHFPADLIQISSILIDWWVDTVIKLSVGQLLGTIKYITSTFSKTLVKFLMTNRDRQGNTCLHYVIGQQFWKNFSALHSTGLVDPDLYNSQGYTVMMVASIIEVSQETLNIFIKMLAIGANLNLQSKQQGQTALFLAALNGNDNTIHLLSSLGADINLADNEGNTPLIIAVMNNKIKSVQAILKSPNVLTDLRNKEGHTALATAEGNQFVDIVDLLKSPRRQQHSERSSYSSVTHNRTFISSPGIIRKFN